MDVYCAPNTGGESFGMVLSEAMAAGTAVLASDLGAFRADYPEWQVRHGIEEILREIHELNVERWRSASPAFAKRGSR